MYRSRDTIVYEKKFQQHHFHKSIEQGVAVLAERDEGGGAVPG
ncbi:hypothetical protein [Paenibacillus apiarius]|nr:hypothetical protein [Paenibacillus apiarius]MEC0118215.1 hypothetical protein [Paenibacillus apiarius]MEC0190376.1 hypothetical protein [Paenibacillus apiarius]